MVYGYFCCLCLCGVVVVVVVLCLGAYLFDSVLAATLVTVNHKFCDLISLLTAWTILFHGGVPQVEGVATSAQVYSHLCHALFQCNQMAATNSRAMNMTASEKFTERLQADPCTERCPSTTSLRSACIDAAAELQPGRPGLRAAASWRPWKRWLDGVHLASWLLSVRPQRDHSGLPALPTLCTGYRRMIAFWKQRLWFG